jgi:hypothetical protein
MSCERINSNSYQWGLGFTVYRDLWDSPFKAIVGGDLLLQDPALTLLHVTSLNRVFVTLSSTDAHGLFNATNINLPVPF